MRKLERMPDIILEDRILFGLTKGKHTIISIEDYERVKTRYGGRVSLGYWRTEARAKEISAMGKELQATCSGIADFKFKWKEIKPRRAYDRSAM
jgi:hypothetical protein